MSTLPQQAPEAPFRATALGALLVVEGVIGASLVPWFIITFLMPRPLREDAWLIAHLFFSNFWAYPLFVLVLSGTMWVLFVSKRYRMALAASVIALLPTASIAVLYLFPGHGWR